jgi:hypothetical protein
MRRLDHLGRRMMMFACSARGHHHHLTSNNIYHVNNHSYYCFISTLQRPCVHSNIFPCDRSQHHQQQQEQTQYQLIQQRYFDSRKVRKRKKAKNPFKVLSVPQGSLYKDVKRKFLKIAMTNHPDTHAEHLSQDEKDRMRDRFIEARIAFESLTADTDGTAILLSEKETEEDAMDNFDSWFKSETGFNTPFHFDMDPETMKEVAKMTETIGGDSGLDRDGGMWALARMVTSAVRTGGDAATILRLESGDVGKDGGRGLKGGELRRRRKR